MFKKVSITILVIALIGGIASMCSDDTAKESASFYVSDQADVISQETTDYIVEKNASLENLCGGQIVVVTVDSLNGADIGKYTSDLFNEKNPGNSQKDNGVLLLLAIEEEDYWCTAGNGLQSRLDNDRLGDILYEYLEPDFADQNYDAGVRSVFDALYAQVSDFYGGEQSQESQSGGVFTTLLAIFFVIFIAVAIVVTVHSVYTKRKKNAEKNSSDTKISSHPKRESNKDDASSAEEDEIRQWDEEEEQQYYSSYRVPRIYHRPHPYRRLGRGYGAPYFYHTHPHPIRPRRRFLSSRLHPDEHSRRRTFTESTAAAKGTRGVSRTARVERDTISSKRSDRPAAGRASAGASRSSGQVIADTAADKRSLKTQKGTKAPGRTDRIEKNTRVSNRTPENKKETTRISRSSRTEKKTEKQVEKRVAETSRSTAKPEVPDFSPNRQNDRNPGRAPRTGRDNNGSSRASRTEGRNSHSSNSHSGTGRRK